MSEPPYPVEPDDHRRARHLFTLKALTERGYGLAIKAADQADASFEAAAEAPAAPPPPSGPNPHQIFECYTRIVRQLIGIEHRVANHTGQARRPYRPSGDAGLIQSGGAARTDGPGAEFRNSAVARDPRRPELHEFIQKATRNSPQRAQLRRAVVASLDEALENDSGLTLPAGYILAEICEEYGLHFDIAKLPDSFLEPPITGPPS